MTKIILNGKSQNYNLNVNEDFVMFLTSKLITCFIDGFTSGMKSQSIAYLLIGSAHIYWILDLEGEVHSIWGLQSSGLQECKGNVFFRSWTGWATIFGRVQKIILKITRLVMIGWQRMMHPLAFI